MSFLISEYAFDDSYFISYKGNIGPVVVARVATDETYIPSAITSISESGVNAFGH